MVQFGPDSSGSWWVSIPGEKNLGPFVPAEAIRTARREAAQRGEAEPTRVEFGSIRATPETKAPETEAAPEPAAKKPRAKKAPAAESVPEPNPEPTPAAPSEPAE